MFEPEELDALIREAANLILASERPCAFTGAGVSQESGIPTYRGREDSVWGRYDIDEVATPFAFHLNPQKVWDFWQLQRDQMRKTTPNPGHLALADMEEVHLTGLPVITQNVDDLHERAGSRNVIHLHGQLMRSRCSRYCKGVPSIVTTDEFDTPKGMVPRCSHCGQLTRPDIILFGEYLHAYPMDQAKYIVNQTDLMIIIGTSGLVAPASKLPLIAQDNGAKLIEINPNPSRITPNVDVFVPSKSSQALTGIVEIMDERFDND